MLSLSWVNGLEGGVGIRAAVNQHALRIAARLRAAASAASVPLGPAIAASWRSRVYENQDGAAAVVSSPFSHILRAFGSAKVIVARDHFYLAIPSANVPRVGHRYATTAEVEAQFGRLFFLPATRPGSLLAFVDRGAASGLPSYAGPATGGRRVYPVLMFVLVRQVHLKKRVDLDTAFAGVANEPPEFSFSAAASRSPEFSFAPPT